MINSTVKNIICTEDVPVVATEKGRVRGFIVDGIATFRGIRYAKAERFMPPVEADAWCGIRDAMNYGFGCPNPGYHTDDFHIGDHDELPFDNFTLPLRTWPENEHCQYLNVWSPDIESKEKKPVMVWIHGGGFSTGSAIDFEYYDGEALSRYGNVVVVSVNHRLNLLGFLNLADYGEEYRYSANVGMLDLVAALKWINNNISAFGGDPQNVTIMGQSGGGGKVITLLQMPAADGLYHRAIVQSGVLDRKTFGTTQEASRALSKEIIEAVGGLDKLKTTPALKLLYISNELSRRKNGRPYTMSWAPVPDENYVGDPLVVGFRKETDHIPMIVGSNLIEFMSTPKGNKENMLESTRAKILGDAFGKDADAVPEIFADAWPGLDGCYAAFCDSLFRTNALEFCCLRARQCSAPVYNYVFGYESPFWGGWMPAHSGEIPFMMHNVATCETMAGGDVSERLQEEITGAWVSFAYTGTPNRAGLPDWYPFSEEDHACMTYSNKASGARKGDFDRSLRELLQKHQVGGKK